ncbi:MAG: condensation domain-containing protein, partial [Bacteroidota bacterium]
MEQFISKLRKSNIDIDVVDGQLNLKVPDDFDATEIIAEIRENKEKLISFINAVKNENQFKIIEPAAVQPYYQLSPAQKRMWFLYEFDKQSLTYNMPQVVRLTGNLNIERLQYAFNSLIHRHESLRTSFSVEDGEPVQKITETVDFKIAFYEGSEEEAQNIIDQFVRPFELDKAPLMRAGIMKLAENECLLMVDMHHIITDGVSQGILVSDFMSFYNDTTLPKIPLQYKDYTEWQNQKAQQNAIAKQKAFWLEQFTGELPVLDLPTDFTRPSLFRNDGGVVYFSIDKEQTQALKSLAEAQGTTLFMVILSIYNVLLSKLTNQEDIVIGTPIAGRHHADLHQIIGLFVNTIALRNYPKGTLTFAGFLDAVKQVTLSSFDNQLYPY